MKQPQLLLIDDEPALADFVANAARECGFDPTVTSNDAIIPRTNSWRTGRTPSRMDLGMPVDGVELLRFLADEDFQGPVLIISGFDRRVLESAFRLGEAQGLNMAGPLEKPVRLEELEELLNRLKPVVPS